MPRDTPSHPLLPRRNQDSCTHVPGRWRGWRWAGWVGRGGRAGGPAACQGEGRAGVCRQAARGAIPLCKATNTAKQDTWPAHLLRGVVRMSAQFQNSSG